MNGRAMLAQTLASRKFDMAIGDAKSAFLAAEAEKRPNGPIFVTTPKDYAMTDHRPEQLFEVINGRGLEGTRVRFFRGGR